MTPPSRERPRVPSRPGILGFRDVRRRHRGPGRVRRARPFYAPFAGIRAACDDKLRDDLVAEFGADIGGFFAESVEVSLKTYPDRAHAEAVFAAAMADAFPDLDVGPKKTAVAFAALSDLAAKFRGELLSRERLLAALAEAVGAELLPAGPLRVHVRSDLNAPEAEAVEVDASPFSGGGGYPGSERWRGGLFQPLEAVARWARERRVQRIALSGSYRLSTAFSVGWSFRSATGFEIDITARPGEWSTDDRAVAGSAPLWQVVEPAGLFDGRLVVGIGVMRDPSADIQATREGLDGAHLLSAFLPAPIVDGQQAQASVQIVKSAVVRAVALLRPAAIDLYYVGPAAFAVALGHRWNALPPTQLHEFIAAEGRYVQTAQLG